MQEKFEDTKVVIMSHKSDRKRTNAVQKKYKENYNLSSGNHTKN